MSVSCYLLTWQSDRDYKHCCERKNEMKCNECVPGTSWMSFAEKQWNAFIPNAAIESTDSDFEKQINMIEYIELAREYINLILYSCSIVIYSRCRHIICLIIRFIRNEINNIVLCLNSEFNLQYVFLYNNNNNNV